MASAQAQIEVVVKNLNSLGKLNKTLDKSSNNSYINEFDISSKLENSIESRIHTNSINNKDHLVKPNKLPRTLFNSPRLTTLINFVIDLATSITKL